MFFFRMTFFCTFVEIEIRAMLQTQRLSYQYPNKVVLEFPDIVLERGEQAVVLGKSGKGKTTFLHLIAGLRRGYQGSILIDNVPLHQLTSTQLDAFRTTHIGIVFQKPHFLKAMTVEENLQVALFFAHKKQEKKEINELLTKLGIAHQLKRRYAQLSEGEKQRLSIAIALINKPSILLADEPTSSLDDEHAFAVIDLLKQQTRQQNTTLLVVTHDERVKAAFDTCIRL